MMTLSFKEFSADWRVWCLVLASLWLAPNQLGLARDEGASVLRVATDAETVDSITVPLLEGFLAALADQRGYAQTRVSFSEALDLSVEQRTLRAHVGDPDNDWVLAVVSVDTDPYALAQEGLADMVISSRLPTGDWWAERSSSMRLGARAIAVTANFSEAPEILTVTELATAVNQARYQTRPVSTAVTQSISNGLLAGGEAGGLRLDPSSAITLESAEAVRRWVREAPDRMGLFPVTAGTEAELIRVGDCGRGFRPGTIETITREYPLVQEAVLFSVNQVAVADVDVLRRLMNFTSAPAGVSLLRGLNVSAGEVYPIRDAAYRRERVSIMERGGNPRALDGLKLVLEDAYMMSRVIRFAHGTSALDPIAERDIAQLISALNREGDDIGRVIIVGFADPSGDQQTNVVLSLARGEGVAERLSDAGIPVGPVIPMGATGFLGCPAGGDNDRLSRRVEVWVGFR